MPDTQGQIAIRANFKGLPKIRKMLKVLADKGIDLQPAMETVSSIMEAAIMGNFDAKVSSRGGKWKPVRDWYAEQKREAGRDPGNILVYDGQLRQSLSQGTSATSQKAVVGTNLAYARIHNFGGTVGAGALPRFAGKTIPRREFLFLTPDAKRQIKLAIMDFIMKNIVLG
ncbi:MAG: phage virion morphogenesis protein [Thermotogota bacterium]